MVAQIQVFSNPLKTHDGVSVSDLAFTLLRRSQLPSKVFSFAQTIEQLTSKIDTKLATASQKPGTTGTTFTIRAIPKPAAILGVFMGQGAQWAAIGVELIHSSDFVCETPAPEAVLSQVAIF